MMEMNETSQKEKKVPFILLSLELFTMRVEQQMKQGGMVRTATAHFAKWGN